MLDRRLIAFLGAAVVLFALVGLASNAEEIDFNASTTTPNSNERGIGGDARDAAPVETDSSPRIQVDRPGELPAWFLWAFGGVAALGALWLLSRQRFAVMLGKRRAADRVSESRMTEAEQADAIADFADDLIDELEFGGEPRLAIQQAYAAVETGFGSRELRRKPAETPLKYLDRVFGRRKQAAPALTRLTDLFQVARFSTEPVDEPMRADAIDALREIRDQYRAVGRAKVLSR